MKAVFSEKIITKIEKSIIEKWTENSSEYKKIMWGISDNKDIKKEVDILFSLFEKYDSNVKKEINLYRGISVDTNIFKSMGYDKLKKGSLYTPDDKAITSFTKSKRIAYDFAFDGAFENKVILKITSHSENMLDISNVSTVAQEEETILTKNVWYNVKQIKKITNGGAKWLLIILQKK